MVDASLYFIYIFKNKSLCIFEYPEQAQGSKLYFRDEGPKFRRHSGLPQYISKNNGIAIKDTGKVTEADDYYFRN